MGNCLLIQTTRFPQNIFFYWHTACCCASHEAVAWPKMIAFAGKRSTGSRHHAVSSNRCVNRCHEASFPTAPLSHFTGSCMILGDIEWKIGTPRWPGLSPVRCTKTQTRLPCHNIIAFRSCHVLSSSLLSLHVGREEEWRGAPDVPSHRRHSSTGLYDDGCC